VGDAVTLRPIRWIAAAGISSAVFAVGALVASDAPAAPSCGRGVVTDVRHGIPVCIHASERPPPGVDLRTIPSVTQLLERRFGSFKRAPVVSGTEPGATTASAGGSVACIGDGIDGDRVQAIYARASDRPDRFSSVVSLIQQYAADADYQVDVSAGQSGQGRRVRYVTTSCSLSVESVTLSPTGDDSFSATRSELEAKGFDRADRKYLVWVDASVGICGLGELFLDDSPTAGNANNSGPMYARVDAPCWGYAEAHELLHTLGAVQGSAPHSTGAGHCVDENDTMCYSDTSGASMSDSCPSLPSWQVDCELDDYFNASPSPTSYLGTHWNVASSGFLEGAPPLPKPPSISLSMPSSFYAGNAVAVRAYPSVPTGRTFSVRWASSRTDCKFFSISALANTFYCPVTAAGSAQVTARVTDSLGMSSSVSRTYTLSIPSRPRRTLATVTSSRTRIPRGDSTTLSGKLVDYYSRKPVIGMRVTIYYRRAGASSWSKLTTRTTGRTGTFSLRVRPSRTTTYMIVSWSSRTWASDQSNTRRISVV
jgi:hypothetical protein